MQLCKSLRIKESAKCPKCKWGKNLKDICDKGVLLTLTFTKGEPPLDPTVSWFENAGADTSL